ncbi:MAG: gliding motility-associated C-terminal domain-containing protein, partial [Saprospiraceae bacterium]
GENVEFILDEETGDFVWDNGSTSFYRFINSPGIYSVTVTNECFFSIDSIEVSIGDAPVFSFPADQQLCSGQTFMLDGSGAVGNYLWQDGSTGSNYLVTSEGTYSLTITSACGSATDSIFISYGVPLAPPDLGVDVAICPGEEYVFYANTPGVNYTWQNGSTADSLVVDSAGTYWLQIANQCSSASDTVTVVVNATPPVVDLPSSLSLCDNAFLTIDAGVSGVNYLWNDGSQGPSIFIGSPGAYSVTVSNTCGIDVDTVNVIDAGSPPFVDLGNDVDICNGDVVNLIPVFYDVNTWLWNDGSTNQTFNISQPGTISVEVSNNCGDFADSLIVSLLPDIPLIDLGADTSLCPGESFNLSIDPNGVNILWSNGSTLSELQVSSPGLVYATITNQCGTASDSIVVAALAGIPPLDLGIDQSLCPGEIITLSPGIANVNYLWNNGSTTNTYNATTAGEIILTISNDCGTATDTVIVVENLEGPKVNLGQDILACEGDVFTLSSDISGVDYLWNDGSTLPDLTTTISGTFILEVSNSCGQDKDTIVVDINGSVPTPDLGPDTLLCDGATLSLISLADSITNIQWQNGSAQPVFTVTVPGDYILNESNHCGDVSDTISIAYLSPPPTVDLGPDQTLCPGESVTLTAPATTATLTWQDGSSVTTFIADQSQIYSLELSNECGTTSDDFELTIDIRSPLIDLNDKYPWCPENIFSFNVTQPFAAEYLWNTGSVLPTIQITSPGLYSVMVLTDCKTVEHDLEVFESDTCIIKNDIYVPNVFSPNDDDRNDYFEITVGSDLDVTSVKCSIYDRWGNLVFGTNTEPIRWDGSFHNKLMNQAVYTYLIHITYLERGLERTQILAGDVTLFR